MNMWKAGYVAVMTLTDAQRRFLADNHAAAMITVGGDGYPKAVRVGVALVEGKLWSSGTADRVRTRRLRQNPRCTLFVSGPSFESLTLEADVAILEGPDAPAQNVSLFRVMESRPDGPLAWHGEMLSEGDFLERLTREHRLIYEFAVRRAYGLL
jgi:hypothetical protein